MNFDPQAKLSLSDIEEFVNGKDRLTLSAKALSRIKKSHAKVLELAYGNEPHYGVNTGFGRLAQLRISKEELVELQVNLLRSHAAGIGYPVSRRVVRRLLVLRAASLGKGFSGVSVNLIKRHLDFLNYDLTPWVPEQGSVGASGDLAPLAHLGLPFIGEGAFYDGAKKIPAKALLTKKKLKPLQIGPKEGLALVNGTQFSLALALEVRDELQSLLDWMILSACLSFEGHRATRNVFDPELHRLKKHPHQQELAQLFWDLLANSPHMKGHKDCSLVQDAYSYRCTPQVMGPSLALLDRADDFLEDEINSVSDNPLFVASGKTLISGGHFHAQYVAVACDLMSMAMATFGNLIERRMDQLVSPLTSRTEPFLAERPGVQSGLMIVHSSVAALASENKTLANPASIDTIPVNGNQEDHVSMAPWAARKSLLMAKNLRRMIAAEMICGVRACVLESTRTGLQYSPAVESFLNFLSKRVPALFKSGDRVFGDDWEKLELLMKERDILKKYTA